MLEERSPKAWVLSVTPFGLEDAGVWLDRADERSGNNLLKLWEAGYLGETVGKISFESKGPRKTKIADYHLLPTDLAVPVVSEELRDKLLSAAEGDVEFFPVEVQINKERSLKRWALHPTAVRPCVDLEKSKIRKWLIPNKVISFYDCLQFSESCLGDHKLVRNENIAWQVVVSEEVKNVFEKYQTPNFRFLRDFEIKEDEA